MLLYRIFLVQLLWTLALFDESEDFCNVESCTTVNVKKPNFVVLLADDLGYGDLSSYGHSSQEWGAIDQLTLEGVRFTQFYSADSMCTPSRAALLTGRLPVRSGMVGGRRVLTDFDAGGLPHNETTIPEILQTLGYKTGMVGKWHLGNNVIHRSDGSNLPSKHGFDFVGKNLPFSVLWDCDETGVFRPDGPDETKCYLYDGDKLYQQPIKFETLTKDMVDGFKTFVDHSKNQPFFFYFSFPHVHTAQWPSKLFKGKSKRGLFGDNLNEMAWAVNEVVSKLKSAELEKNTLVLFLSDHGPHREACKYGGVTGGLKGGKSNSYEGGFRIPAMAWWPGTIPSGRVSNSVLSSLDILPTFVSLAGGKLPDDRKFDGVSLAEIFMGKTAEVEETTKLRPIFFYCNRRLMAVRIGDFKVHYFTSKMLLGIIHKSHDAN